LNRHVGATVNQSPFVLVSPVVDPVGVVLYFLAVYAVLAGVFAACLSGMLAVLPGC
jgi:hypothetical protein